MTMAIITDHTLGNVWQRSGGKFNAVLRRESLRWMPPAHQRRAERLRQGRMLFDGRHREYYLGEGRSQYTYPPLREDEPPYYRPYNLLTNVAVKMADLLFGESPRLYIDDPAIQDRIDAIADRSWLMALLIDAAAECCWAGDTVLEVTRAGGNVFVSHVPADEIYPVGIPGPDRQYGQYVRYAAEEVTADGRTQTLVLVTRYTTGRIDRSLHTVEQILSGAHQLSRQTLPLERWPVRDDRDQPLAESEPTGLSRPSIVWVPNGFGGVSDYDGLIEAQDALHASHTQIGRVIAKHADPRVAFPESAFGEDGNIDASAEAFAFRTKEDIPQYIVWNAELAAAMEDRRFDLSSLATISEMPLSLLGVKDDAAVESARKMRLAAAPALAKAQRKAVVWREAIRMVIELALEAEGAPVPAGSVGVEMRDGLPDDELDRAQVIATLRSAQVMSRRRALQQQWLDNASVEEELGQLDAEAQHDMPSILFGEAGGDMATGNAQLTTEQETEAA